MTAAAHPVTSHAPVATQITSHYVTQLPVGQVFSKWTERDVQLYGPKDGIDTFAKLDDAVAAAKQLSAGDMPGLAVREWRGGFRLHDVRTNSESWQAMSTHGRVAPYTKRTAKSNVPFAMGNLRFGPDSLAIRVKDDRLAAIVDGARMLVPQQDGRGAKLVPAIPRPDVTPDVPTIDPDKVVNSNPDGGEWYRPRVGPFDMSWSGHRMPPMSRT